MKMLRTGVLLFLACSPAAAQSAGEPSDWAHAQLITIGMSNFAFEPSVLHLHANTSYRLHFVKTGGSAHDFDAPAFFQAVAIAPADRAKAPAGKVEVEAGEAVDVNVLPQTRGSYPVRCSHFLHAMFGMKAVAIID